MDRRSALKNAGIAGVLAAGIAPAVRAQAAIRWRMASSFPKSLDTIHGAAEVFAKQVKAMQAAGLDAMISCSPENFAYLTGFVVPSQPLIRHRHAMVIVTADGKTAIFGVDMKIVDDAGPNCRGTARPSATCWCAAPGSSANTSRARAVTRSTMTARGAAGSPRATLRRSTVTGTCR